MQEPFLHLGWLYVWPPESDQATGLQTHLQSSVIRHNAPDQVLNNLRYNYTEW